MLLAGREPPQPVRGADQAVRAAKAGQGRIAPCPKIHLPAKNETRLAALVEQFERHRADYLRPDYSEAQARPAANFDAPIKIVIRQTGDSIVATIDTDRNKLVYELYRLTDEERDCRKRKRGEPLTLVDRVADSILPVVLDRVHQVVRHLDHVLDRVRRVHARQYSDAERHRPTVPLHFVQ